jgi:peptide/nickel transport system permease protein
VRRALAFTSLRRGKIGLTITVFTLLVAVLGPVFAPHGPAAIIGAPGQGPSSSAWLGTDYIGHDVLSRVLWGGWSVVWLSAAATALAYVIGVIVGLTAGYSRSLLDPVLMRAVDVILAFPPLLFFLIVATSVGTSELILVIGIGVVLSPGIARIVYTATREAATRAFVEAAVARGERTSAVLRREILPNISGPIVTNLGLTLTFAILLIAAVNFLNLGVQPPAANWALMISENRPVLSLNEWATIAPAAMIALLTIGVNLVADAVAEALGRSGEDAPVPGLERAPSDLAIP